MKNLLIFLILFFVAFPVQAQRYLDEATDGVACWGNTVKDGSGTNYQLLTDADGNLQVDIVSGGGTGGTSQTDDAAFTAGSGSGTPMMGFATSDSVDSGDVGVLAMDTARNLKVSIEADNVGIGGGTQYTEDVATANPQVGTATMIERDDALSTVTPIEGDWIGLRGSAEGALWTQDFNSDAILADTASMDTNLATVAGAVSGSEMQCDIVSSAAVPVTDNAGSLTIDGTVAATQSGTWNVTNISGTVSLPTGAATAANQSTLNGRFPATATAADNVTNPSLSKIGAYGFAFDGTTWDRMRGDSTNGLLVNLGANNDVSGTVTCNAGTNLNTSALALDASVDGVEGLLTTIDADTGGILADTAAIQTAVEILDNIVSGSEAQVDLVGSVPAGTNLIGDVNIQSSSTSGDGASAYLDADCDNTAQSVKAGSGNLKGWYISNANTTVACVQIFNIASGSVTVGTSTPTLSLCIPPDDAAANVMTEPGIGFGTQISVACTTTATGSTDPTTGLVVNLMYE